MEPAPGDKTSEWRATLLALLALPGFGAAMAVFRDALLARPWPFVALAGIGAGVAAVYVVCRTWLKGRGVATVAALLVLMLAAPARADGPQLRAPLPADVPAVEAAPVLTAPAPSLPVRLTPAQQATCVAERAALAVPEAIAACTSATPPPPMDTRTFVSVLISGSVTALQSLVGTLVLAFNPAPLGK